MTQFEDVPMFDVDSPEVTKPPRPKKSGRPRWSKYAPKNPLKCDDCNLVLHLAAGDGPAARRAHWRRMQDGEDLLLCYAHAQQRREEDGLKPLEAPVGVA